MSTYDVVLLIEQGLSEIDARQVYSLHEQVEEQVCYHLLLPVENAAARIESGIGALGAGEVMAAPAMAISNEGVEELQKELLQDCREELASSVALLTAAGARAHGTPVTDEPIAALTAKVAEVDAREAIILTRSHVVAEFFHLDWTSRARRKLGVPVLHLLEHETFDGQAESFGEEGVTGL
ncbi:hypothetical protein [Nocardioides terrisoli]|uniref:hypothetical protein n=1 Tax=Nocardioides terrisoli TaxID=3388267 RepID=UPI00287B9B9D|nr:hypothetical protein [Nocardioides marmorisolisilvae]